MAELPQLVTEPGLARPFYTGNTRTEAYVTEALRALGDVSINASTPTRAQFTSDVNHQQGTPSAPPSAFPDNESIVSFGRGGPPGDSGGSSQYRGQYGYDAPQPSLGERIDYDRLPTASQADEYGAYLPQPVATRFRSLSARKPPPASSSNLPPGDDLSSISQGIGSPIQSQAGTSGRFATFPVKRKDSTGQVVAEPLVSSRSSLSDVEQTEDPEDAVPKYEAIEGPPGPPPGAAPPAMPHASIYGGYDPRSYDSGPSFVPDNTVDNEDDIQLPYMPSPRESLKPPFGSRPLPVPRPRLSPGREVESVEEPNGRSPSSTTKPDSFPDPLQTPLASTQEISAAPTVVAQDPPLPAPVEDPDDEGALNAAAAREVSRELDSLMYQPPPAPISRDPSPQPLAPPTPTTPPTIHTSPRSSIESVPPASSPFARARGRVSGVPPVPRTSSERLSPINGPPDPFGSTPSSPAQRAQLPPPGIVLGRPSSPSLTSLNNTSLRTPPELPPSLSAASSQRSLPQPPGLPFSPAPGKPSPGTRQGAGMISVAAFRRPVARTATGSESPVTGSSQDISPLTVRKKDLRGSHTPRTSGTMGSMPLPSGAQPPEPSSSPQELHNEDEFDYISAYYSAGGDELAGAPPSYTESRALSGSLR